MRKGFSHKTVFEQRPQGSTVLRKGIPREGTSANARRPVHWDVGLPYRQWKQFADGLGNRKKRMPLIATLKNREGASSVRRKKRTNISR